MKARKSKKINMDKGNTKDEYMKAQAMMVWYGDKIKFLRKI